MQIDLTTMPTKKRYEDTYGAYMDIFHKISQAPKSENVEVHNPPICWIPLLDYLACKIHGYQYFFKHDRLLPNFYRDVYINKSGGIRPDRTTLEVLVGFRPELVDALYKLDVEWDCERKRAWPAEKEFIVTTNSAFFRQEVQEYLVKLHKFSGTEKRRKVVLLPCSADKPYPSLLHQRVLDIIPDDSWYIANVTGTLGIVPHALWSEMPHYDAGLPNYWRVYSRIQQYFARNFHSRIVSYVDFYADVLQRSLHDLGQRYKLTMVISIDEASQRDYLPLHEDRYLSRLMGVLT